MDPTTPLEDTVREVTRESLIAISNSLPETYPASPELSSEKAPEIANSVTYKEGTELDYWSKLISLSYIAPDELLPEELEG